FIEDKDFKSNSAAYFSGVSHITVQNNPIFQNWNELTISVWLKPDVGYGNPYPPTGYIFIIGRWLASGSNTSTWGLVFLQPSKLLQGVTHDGITTSKCSTDKLNERVWTHVAFTYKSGISKIYINGIEENSINAASLQNSPYNLEIGWHKDNICQYKGGMDDLKIFKRALSDNEILQLSK
ncbi:MAG: LamG domain-containing protein, partial [Ignavibacteriae bacterium]|nr:LamG domain-containing protein [Ignavibacteriota bacterium]